MEDTTISVIGIIIAIIIMFIVPLILIADRADDISQLIAQTATVEFVDEVIKSGKITEENYQKLANSLESSGNTYNIELEVKILDENTSKKATDNSQDLLIGNNTYYSLYTTQILDKLGSSASNNDYNLQGKLVLKQGDQISVIVKNSSTTLSQSLKSFYYKAKGEDLHIIAATASGTVAINGST